jgi:membrane protein
MTNHPIIQLLKETLDTYNRVKGPRLAAALAYSAIFSLAPLLVIAVGVAGFFVGAETAQAQIHAQVAQAMNPEVADFVLRLLEPTRRPANNILATAVGIGALLWGATGMFVQIRDAINDIWGIPAPQGLAVFTFLRRYGLSMLLVFASGALFLLMIVASTYVSQAHALLGSERLLEGWLVRLSEFCLTFAIATLLFMIIYRVTPDRPIPWTDAIIGAVVTALLFSIGKLLLAQYLTHFAPGSAYGAAGAFVVLLVWIQFSAQIFFFGAALTHVWSRRRRATPNLTEQPAAGALGHATPPASESGRVPLLSRLRGRR